MNDLITREDYEHLVEECRVIITETEFTSRWALVEGYHLLGQRISLEKSVSLTDLAKDLNKSVRTIERAVQFYKKYPILDKLPEGKNTSWTQIANKYLADTPKVYNLIYIECPQCHYKWKK